MSDVKKFVEQCHYANCETNENICHIYVDMNHIPELLRHLNGYQPLSLSEQREKLEAAFRREFAKGVNEHGK